MNEQRAIDRQLLRALGQVIQGKVDASVDVLRRVLPGTPHVDNLRRLGGQHPLGREGRAHPLSRRAQLRSRREAVQTVLQVADDTVEADAPEPHLRLLFAAEAPR